MNPQYRPTSLYVGNLSPDVTETDLHTTFEKAFEGKQPNVPHVVSVKVCRDAITRRSLGYGYVNFAEPAFAEKALDALNYIPIGASKRPCHIMWSQRDPTLRKSGLGNILVKNLDPSIDSKTLHDTFSQYGSILSCRVMYDENGKSKGFGFVHFQTEEEAQKALKGSNKTSFQGTEKEISVIKYKPRKELVLKIEEYKKNFVNVYVKNIPLSMSDEEFAKLFEVYGTVTSCLIMKDLSDPPKSRGFGFVCYKAHEEAQKAIDDLNGNVLPGTEIPLYVTRHQKKIEREEEKRRQKEQRKKELFSRSQNVNLYVKNIDETWTEAVLKEHFQIFGEITSCTIMKDKEVSRGFGFVCFSTPEESSRALNDMNGKMFGSKPLYVAYHQPKEMRRQFLETQRMRAYPYMMPPQYGYPQFYQARPARMGYPNAYNPNAYNRAPPYGVSPNPPNQRGQVRPGGMPQQRMIGSVPRTNPTAINQRPQNSNRAMQGMQGMQGMQQGKSNSAYKFSNNVRNSNINPNTNVMVQQQQQVATQGIQDIANQPPELQKNLIGDSLYYKINETYPNYAAKVTGMLLEMDIQELIYLLETPPVLDERVKEAIELIENPNKIN